MIIPFSKGQDASQGPQQKPPSETDMLMALATMHQLGRIQGPESLQERAQGVVKDFKREQMDPSSPLYKKGKDTRVETDEGDVVIHGSEGEGLMIPGDDLPDRERGGTKARSVKGT